MTNPFDDAGDDRFKSRNPFDEEDRASLRRQLAAQPEFVDLSRMSDGQVRRHLANLRATGRLPARHARTSEIENPVTAISTVEHAISAAVAAVIPSRPLNEPAVKPVHWLEVELIGEDDSPIGWEKYEVTLPNGVKVTGNLDGHGYARIENIEQPGLCSITFPRLDRSAWDRAGAA